MVDSDVEVHKCSDKMQRKLDQLRWGCLVVVILKLAVVGYILMNNLEWNFATKSEQRAKKFDVDLPKPELSDLVSVIYCTISIVSACMILATIIKPIWILISLLKTAIVCDIFSWFFIAYNGWYNCHLLGLLGVDSSIYYGTMACSVGYLFFHFFYLLRLAYFFDVYKYYVRNVDIFANEE